MINKLYAAAVQKLYIACFTFFLIGSTNSTFAQPGWSFDLFGKEKKPEKYEEKLLPSEKTGNKKFTLWRKFKQNTTSHYNFYFNANNKLNGVVDRAKISNKDDYSKLLSFYPYSLDVTASQKTDLDSVIYKATAGILLHDLRSSWVDNFYLLIGKAYFLKKDFDSAELTFQFINYNLFPRKKKDDDYNKVIGSNNSETGKSSVSIADKESRNLLTKMFSRPASRNEALIWQIKTSIEKNDLSDAAGLISILQNDPNLPKRLQNDLHEVTAYWFYTQNIYDSSANRLQLALSNADDKEDKSRWQFLLAQMYERIGRYDDAEKYYAKAAQKTTSVIMDIYAKLNSAKMMRNSGNQKELSGNISDLLKMAKKDRYDAFKDVIYFSAAQLSLLLPDTVGAMALYQKSIDNATAQPEYKDKSFLQMANISFAQQNYSLAKNYYDSLSKVINEPPIDSATIEARKQILARLAPAVNQINFEDSVQGIAALPEAERKAYVKQLSKKLRKAQGLKEENITDDNGNAPIQFGNEQPKDLFAANEAKGNQQWYFYNTSQRAQGYNIFKQKWGKRANTDNWRKKATVTALVNAANKAAMSNGNPDEDLSVSIPLKTEEVKEKDISYDGLMADIPLTPEQLDSSNAKLAKALFVAAQIFQNELEDYNAAINKYSRYEEKFATQPDIADVYLGLSFCYRKLGNNAKADYYKNIVVSKYAGTKAATILTNPAALETGSKKSPEATKKYEDIYNLFIEGQFEKAIAEKKVADSLYGKTYWSPQLLYIEAVHYAKERKDSAAIASLKNIIALYPTSPISSKAQNLADVLSRRAEIEKYLTELEVTRAQEDQVVIVDDKPVLKVAPPPAATKPAVTQTPTVKQPVLKPITDSVKIPAPKPVLDTTKKVIKPATDTSKTIVKPAAPTAKPASMFGSGFELSNEQPHYVVMVLDKVDEVYVREAKNALDRYNKSTAATTGIISSRTEIDKAQPMLLFGSFGDAATALKYYDKLKRAAPQEISWLQPAKYSFIIITEANLEILKTNKNLKGYKELLNKNYTNGF
jgi:outer membrane protein assembly factor BamD (BamD/ComL family)